MPKWKKVLSLMYKKFGKRAIDLLLSAVGLVLLSPIYLIITLAIKLEDPGPVFFKQKRVGVHKSYFNIVKFRSMRQDTPHDMPTHMLENPDRWITKTGKFIRKTSLDELPQIAQIFTGKMSIVGPRPALWNQFDLIQERDKYGANDVVPGLTGWAQVNGRDELEIEEKARLDGEYAKNLSFKLDLKIFFMTVGNVFKGSGVVEGGPKELKKENEK
jgi:O-antigen biosynthesis protein WbqP